MNVNDLNQRITVLEGLIKRLINGELSLRNLNLSPLTQDPINPPDDQAKTPQPTASSALRFYYYADADSDEKTKCFGSLDAGPLNGRIPALNLHGESGTHINIQSNGQISVQAGQSFIVNTQNINLEASRLNLDGEFSGKIRYTDPFIWRSGQPPLKMINQNAGFPVIIQISGDLSLGNAQVKTYINGQDGYWYLSGNSKKEMEVHAIVVGRV